MEASPVRGLSLTSLQLTGRYERLVRVVARAQQVTVIGGAVTLPLAVFGDASDTYVLPKLLVARALALALLALWLARSALEQRLSIKRTPLDLGMALFVSSAAISTVFAVNRNLALFGGYDRYEGFLTIALYGALFWLSVQSLEGPQSGRRLLTALLVSGYVAAILALGQSLLASAHGVAAGESAFTFGGMARASGTMGNPTLLATFLAMLLPLSIDRVIAASSWLRRITWLNVAAVLSMGLLFTFSRAGLIAAGVAVLILLMARLQMWRKPRRFIWLPLGVLVGASLLALPGHGGVAVGQPILTRVVSIANLTGGSNATRLHVWNDSLRLIASRPVVGFGPDTFGLVYPHFQTGEWTPGYRIDKAHADALQVASTQGLLGLAGYVGLLVGALVMFWRARPVREVMALGTGWLAYELITQVNFSWLPAAAPFWIFLGAAAVCAAKGHTASITFHSGVARAVLALAAGLALLLLVPAVIRPYQAEASFSMGLRAELRGDATSGLALMQEARHLSPHNPVYAVAAGNLFLMDGRFDQARASFKDAIDLGSEDPAAQRALTIIDQLTGRQTP